MTAFTIALIGVLLVPVIWGMWTEYKERLSRPLSDKWPHDRSGR